MRDKMPQIIYLCETMLKPLSLPLPFFMQSRISNETVEYEFIDNVAYDSLSDNGSGKGLLMVEH